MKIKYFTIALSFLVLAGCQTEKSTSPEIMKIGFVGNDGGAFIASNDDSMKNWLEFCELHASKDIEGMMSLCRNDILVELTNGQKFEGKEAFKEGLTNWMANSEVSINQNWGVPLTYVNNVDTIDNGTWIVSGHNLVVKSGNNVHTEDNHVNVYMEAGLIQYIKVYTHEITDEEAVDVTFSVNMANYEGEFSSVGVFGTFNDWCGTCNELLDEDGDLIYEGTATIPVGSLEYKFILDNQNIEETFDAGTNCTRTTDIYTNRIATIEQATSLKTVCFNSCDDCQ